MHLVREVFICPHCRAPLETNVGRAYNEGVVVFGLLMCAWIAVAILNRIEWLAAGSSIAFIVAFYIGHLWYRKRLNVKVDAKAVNPNSALNPDVLKRAGYFKR